MGIGNYTTNADLSQPVIALGISSLSLLLLVVVLLSVPGPAQGMYWFQMDSPTGEGAVLKTGVMGWCWAGVSRATRVAGQSNGTYMPYKKDQ